MGAQFSRRRRSRDSRRSRGGIGSRQLVSACSYWVMARSCATRATRSCAASDGGRRARRTVRWAEFHRVTQRGKAVPVRYCGAALLTRTVGGGVWRDDGCCATDHGTSLRSRPAPQTVRDIMTLRLWPRALGGALEPRGVPIHRSGAPHDGACWTRPTLRRTVRQRGRRACLSGVPAGFRDRVRSERLVAAAFVGGRPAQKILGPGRGGLTVRISLSQGLLPSGGSQGSPRL